MVPIPINNSFAEEHYYDICIPLLNRIEKILDAGGINIKNKGFFKLSNVLEDDFELFISNPGLNLKPLIMGCPDFLENYIIEIYRNKFSYVNEWDEDYVILKRIFVEYVYENNFDKWRFVKRIDIDTCPYCNRNYIFTSKKKQKVKPEIDHFYPKHLYPILGISYFNLIPSCESCNGQSAKYKKDPFSERILSPYVIKDNDFKLTHRINNIAIINPLSAKSDVEVFFKANDLIKPNLETFNLKELYELHYDHAIELIIKKRLKYSKKYRDYLSSYRGLQFSKSEIDRMILGNYALEKEQHKRPLSKMYQDIGRELGLIK